VLFALHHSLCCSLPTSHFATTQSKNPLHHSSHFDLLTCCCGVSHQCVSVTNPLYPTNALEFTPGGGEGNLTAQVTQRGPRNTNSHRGTLP
jgi:hypothetical protein